MFNKSKHMVIACALGIMLVAGVAVRPAMAYFTDTVTASKKVGISVGADVPTTTEQVEGLIKNITIENTGNYDLYIRVKAVCGSQYKVEMLSGEGWSEKDGFFYYDKPVLVNSGEESVLHKTSELRLEIKVDDEAVAGQDFNVIIVQEATKVLYDEAGNPYADWNFVINQDEQKADATEDAQENMEDTVNNTEEDN